MPLRWLQDIEFFLPEDVFLHRLKKKLLMLINLGNSMFCDLLGSKVSQCWRLYDCSDVCRFTVKSTAVGGPLFTQVTSHQWDYMSLFIFVPGEDSERPQGVVLLGCHQPAPGRHPPSQDPGDQLRHPEAQIRAQSDWKGDYFEFLKSKHGLQFFSAAPAQERFKVSFWNPSRVFLKFYSNFFSFEFFCYVSVYLASTRCRFPIAFGNWIGFNVHLKDSKSVGRWRVFWSVSAAQVVEVWASIPRVVDSNPASSFLRLLSIKKYPLWHPPQRSWTASSFFVTGRRTKTIKVSSQLVSWGCQVDCCSGA